MYDWTRTTTNRRMAEFTTTDGRDIWIRTDGVITVEQDDCVGDKIAHEQFRHPHTVLFDGSGFLVASDEWDDYLTEKFVSNSVISTGVY